MKKQLITIAIASTLLAGTNPAAYASTSDDEPGKKRQYIGTGIGAVAGGILAGPVGVVAGGLIGNLGHLTAQSIYFLNQLPFGHPADGRTAWHGGHFVEVYGH